MGVGRQFVRRKEMALQKTTVTPQGFDATNAYHRVEGVSLKAKDEISFRVRSYKDASEAVAFYDAGFFCAYDLAGENPIKQAYEHLKTHPEFAGAADV
jgi:hypothetical protein